VVTLVYRKAFPLNNNSKVKNKLLSAMDGLSLNNTINMNALQASMHLDPSSNPGGADANLTESPTSPDRQDPNNTDANDGSRLPNIRAK
jgi:hypothetical protein